MTMNLELFDGLSIEGKSCNILFYFPDGGNELHAQYWVWKGKSDDVIYEHIVKDFQEAISCICIFREMNGEDRQKILSSTKEMVDKFFVQ